MQDDCPTRDLTTKPQMTAHIELGCSHLAIEPDLPPQAIGPQGRALPVVFDQPHIIGPCVYAQGSQTAQVQLYWVARVWLQDDLHSHTV